MATTFVSRAARRLLPLAVIVLGGCSVIDVGPRACTADFRFGLQLFVQDSVTGAWAASGARLITEDARGPVDTAQSFPTAFPAGRPDLDPQPLLGAGERAGLYRVTVRKPGYADWVRTGVRIVEDECHVRPVSDTARLRPLP